MPAIARAGRPLRRGAQSTAASRGMPERMSFSFRESGAAVGLGVAEGAADGLVEGLAEWLDCDGSGEPIGLWEADGCREAVAVLGAGEALGGTIPTQGEGARGGGAGGGPPPAGG